MRHQADQGRCGPCGDVLLTRRELEVVGLIAEGLSCREAAQRMSRSPRTIENHLRSVYQKLHVHNRVELVRAAEERGLLGSAVRHETRLPQSEMELRGCALKGIEQIHQRLAGHEHHHYFGELALALAEAFGTRWAGITEITTHDNLLDIIAIAENDELGHFLHCHQDESPCGAAITQGECVVWSGLSEQFPNDTTVVDCNAHSYVGVLLEDRLLGRVGSLWIMDDKPIRQDLLPLEVLRLLAPRAAAELAVAKTLDRLDEQWCDPDEVGMRLD